MKKLLSILLGMLILKGAAFNISAQTHQYIPKKLTKRSPLMACARKIIVIDQQLEKEQAFKEVVKLRSFAPIGSIQYEFLNTLFLTYEAKNSLSAAKINLGMISKSKNWWPEDGTYVDFIFKKNEKRTIPAIEQALDNVQQKERSYKSNRSNLEWLKKHYPIIAKKYANLEKRLHL